MAKRMFKEHKTGLKGGRMNLLITNDKNGGGRDKEDWYFANQAEIRDVLATASPGDILDCRYVQKGEYWNLNKVAIETKAGGAPNSGGGQVQTQSGKSYTPREKVAAAGGFREPDEINRTEALKLAIKTVSDALASAENFGKLFKKTTTMDVVETETLSLAESYMSFIKGKKSGADPESSTKDLGGNDPEPNPDDDIPF